MDQNKIKRNVVIYIIGVFLLATIGGLVTAGGNEIGGLIFVISPIFMMALLRFFGGDGWQDAGLSLKLVENWRWYLFSLFAYPITMALVIALGVLFGVTQVNGNLSTLLPAFLAGFAAQLIPRMLFALFEEWGWRGYLEPRLVALNVPDLRRHLFVGFIWALWHFPLILSTNYTEIQYALFLPIFVIGVTLTALVYGQLRKASGTVWTAVLMHGFANAVAWGILQNNLVTFNNKLLANISPESIFMILLWGALGWWLLNRRKA
jgi:membrane protease YdiL (CAAX protease family)